MIVVDSDDEADTRRSNTNPSASSKTHKRKRNEGDAGAVRSGEIVELLDSDEEQEVAAKKSRTRKGQTYADAPSGAASSRQPVRQLGEVIIID